MTFEEAKEIARSIIDENDTIIVLSDGAMYLNADSKIIEDHANKEGLEIFRVKPEVQEVTKKKSK